MRDKILEVMAHAVCPFTDTDDAPCMKCPQDEVGPNGGRRGCMWINAKAADAILTALQAEGMAVVPVGPTQAMIDAGDVADGTQYYDGRSQIEHIWSAMLAAHTQEKDA